jgi:uncharacterized protein (PEP-CTERM system associated)
VSIRGGSTAYVFDPNGQTGQGSRLNSYYFGMEISHQIAGFLSHRLNVQRNIEPGLNQGSDYIEQLTGTYSIAWALTRYITLTGSFSYEHGTQPLQSFDLPVQETYDRFGFSPSLSWQLTNKFSSSVTYSHWDRLSNLADHNYADNSLTLRLNYVF